jgi:hypothetical protein
MDQEGQISCQIGPRRWIGFVQQWRVGQCCALISEALHIGVSHLFICASNLLNWSNKTSVFVLNLMYIRSASCATSGSMQKKPLVLVQIYTLAASVPARSSGDLVPLLPFWAIHLLSHASPILFFVRCDCAPVRDQERFVLGKV